MARSALSGNLFYFASLARSTSDVLGGPRNSTDGRAQAASGGPRVPPQAASLQFQHFNMKNKENMEKKENTENKENMENMEVHVSHHRPLLSQHFVSCLLA